MKVEILEERLSSDGFSGQQGDRFSVPDEVGKQWCANGWAKDMTGEVQTGERNTNPVQIKPEKINQTQSTEEVE